MTLFQAAVLVYFLVGFGYWRGFNSKCNINTFFSVVPFWLGVLLGRNTK